MRHFRDENHNYVQWFEIPEAHTELIIDSIARIHTTSQYQEAGRPTGIGFETLTAGEHMDMLQSLSHPQPLRGCGS